MSNLNVNGNYESKIAQTGSTVSSTQTQQAKDPSSLFGKKERWVELGLTKEQYENFCAKDPAFGTKSLDEQKKVLAGLDVEVAAPAEEAQQSAHTSEATGTVQANTTTETAEGTTAQLATSQPTETQSVENNLATTAEITQAETVEEESQPAQKILTKAEIDERKAFNKMSTEEKLSIIIEDYAQNNYRFGDADNRHKEEDWNALSSEAKQAEVEKSKQHLNGIIQKYASQISKKGKVTDTETLLKYILQSNDKNSDTNKVVNNLLDSLHTDLEIAKQNEYSIKDFVTEEPEIKDRFTYEYIDSIYKNSPNDAEEALSASDKHYFSQKNIELEAVKSYLIKEKGVKPDVSLCFDDITPEMLAERGIKDKKDLFKVTTTYFEEKTAEYNKMSGAQKASLTDAEKQSYEYMKDELAAREELTKTKLGQAYLYGKGEIQKPDPPSLLDKMLKEKEAGFEKFQTSMQIRVLSAALEKSSKNEKEYAKNLSACIQTAMAEGKIDLVNNLFKLGMKKCPNKLKSLLSSKAAFVVGVAHKNEMTAPQVTILAERGEECESPEDRTTAASAIRTNAPEAHRVPLANVYINAKDQETRDGTVNLRNDAKDAKTQAEVDKIITEKGNIETNALAIDTTQLLFQENQIDSLARHTKDAHPELLKIATKVPSRLKNSAKAGKIVFGATQKVKDKKVRVEIQNSLADDVIKYKNAADQIAMHQTLMTSKDEAVLTHAANNIYKYQEAAQAKAIDATKATGNTKAIDEAMKNYDKYSKSVQQEPKYKEMQRETEARKTQEIAEQVADFHAQYEKLTGQKVDVSSKASDTEIKMAYVKEFLNSSPQEQFKMISKIPASWQTTVFSRMAQYCPQMLTGLVKQGYGNAILKTPGLSLDVISTVINVMLVQQDSDKKSAIKYVKAHKSMFSDATLEKVEELTAQNKPKTSQHSVMPAFGTVKGALRPVKSAIYPDTDQLDVYNA
mgnify:CR=1 FL=1